MFGVLAGVRSISAVCATFAARFLPTASTFQVSNNVVTMKYRMRDSLEQ